MNRRWTAAALTAGLAFLGALMCETGGEAAVKWPAGQLLPTLSKPASTLDLMALSSGYDIDALGPEEQHKTGQAAPGGWRCRVGVDTPNAHMLYGPYDTSFPAGPNDAGFKLRLGPGSGAASDEICVLDIYDATANKILASQTITRAQFASPGVFQNFDVPFDIPALGHAMEFRVFWTGASNLTVKSIGLQRSPHSEAAVLFSTLKGLVNSKKPRIFSDDSNSLKEEGEHTWLDTLGLGYKPVADNWTLIAKYRHEIKGLVVYDDHQLDTINLATTIAGQRKAIVAPPLFVSRLTSAPYNLPILVDLRGKYSSGLAVYEDLFNTYWPRSTHRAIVGLNPMVVFGSVREYATAIGAAVIWLDPRDDAQNKMLGRFLSSMGAGTVYLGWWPEEGSGVTAASKYGVATCASDWSTNLSVFSGTSRTVRIKGVPPAPPLENKIYVAFIVSDGDNLQYVEHRFRKLWSDPARGQVPLGWTLSPAMLDAMPAPLNYLYKTVTPNDCLLSGPSGYGYTYPNVWRNPDYLNEYIAKSNDYCRRAGFRIITVWNTINGGIDPAVGKAYATYAPSLLGLTAQNSGGDLSIYGGTLPSQPFSANYCPTIASVKMEIGHHVAGWPGTAPRFVLIQVQPWGDITPSGLVDVMHWLGPQCQVVRPDVMFELIREANHLPVTPSGH